MAHLITLGSHIAPAVFIDGNFQRHLFDYCDTVHLQAIGLDGILVILATVQIKAPCIPERPIIPKWR